MRLGLFPVKVEAGAQLFDQVRFYGTDDHSELWGLVAGQPEIVATGPGLVKQGRSMGAAMTDGTRSKWTLEFVDGSSWLASPTGGCGCGHKLKSFNPEKAVRA